MNKELSTIIKAIKLMRAGQHQQALDTLEDTAISLYKKSLLEVAMLEVVVDKEEAKKELNRALKSMDITVEDLKG